MSPPSFLGRLLRGFGKEVVAFRIALGNARSPIPDARRSASIEALGKLIFKRVGGIHSPTGRIRERPRISYRSIESQAVFVDVCLGFLARSISEVVSSRITIIDARIDRDLANVNRRSAGFGFPVEGRRRGLRFQFSAIRSGDILGN